MGDPEQFNVTNDSVESVEKKSKEEKTYEKLKNRVREFFQSRSTGKERIEEIISKTESYLGVYAGNEAKNIKKLLFDCQDIEGEDEFTEKVTEILKPLLDFRLSQPEAFEQIARKEFVKNGKFIPVNEMLSYGRGEDGWLHIHIAPHEASSMREKLKLFKEGMKKFAEMAQGDDSVMGLKGTSWIVTEHPRILERFHFTLTGKISEELRERHFSDEERETQGAYISREELIKRYL